MADYTPTLMPLPATAQGNMVTTPDALRAQREYAKALLYGSGQQPVKHWTQGVSNMVSALMGGQTDYNATQQEMAARQNAAGAENPLNAQAPTGAVPLSFTGGPSSEGQQNSGDAPDAKAIAGLESGGNYASVGNATKTGDRAYGKYQVMGANIPEWTQQALGKSLSPKEFLSSPQAQEAVFRNKFDEYTKKYGPEGAARAWFAGEGGMNNPNDKDVNGMTVARFGQTFARNMPSPSGGASAFSGDAAPSPAAAAVTAAALRGQPPQFAENTQVAAGGARGPSFGVREHANPSGGGIYIDPNLIRPKVQYSTQQMGRILASPWIPDGEKAAIRQEGINQNQPIAVPYPGGTVYVDPRDPRRQQFIPDLHYGTKKLPGGLEYQVPSTVGPGPNGGIIQTPATQAPIGPRSDAGPAATPSAAPQGGPAAVLAPVQAAAAGIPVPAPRPPEAGPAANAIAAAAPPVQVASLDPTAGVAQAASQQPLTPTEQQMMAMVKPSAPEAGPSAIPPTIPAAATVAQNSAPVAPASNPLARAIRTKPPSADYTQQDWDSITGYQDLERQNAIDKEAGVKGVDASMKKYDTLSTQAQNARKLMPNIDIAQSLMNDPNFNSGITANISLAYNRVRAAFPSLFGEGAQYAAAPNEVFNKVIAGSILDNMRTALGGLGQVRLAEIDLLKQASASQNNTPAANRALLELSRRSLTQLDRIDQMGQAYQSGDEVVNPVTGQVLLKANVNANGEPEPRRGLDSGFDKLARKFVLENPTTTSEEAQDYKKLFNAGKAGLEPSTAPTPGQQTAPAPINSKEEYDALPKGKPYRAPDGSTRIKQ